jgi:hypothetical protein
MERWAPSLGVRLRSANDQSGRLTLGASASLAGAGAAFACLSSIFMNGSPFLGDGSIINPTMGRLDASTKGD